MTNEIDVILLDDDVEIGKLLNAFLTKHGVTTTVLTNPSDLFPTIQKISKVDLIILDLMLPNTSGYELCKQLRNEYGKIPIIMLTALTDDIEKILGLEIGADDYLTKPFNPHELLARIKAILRRLTPMPNEGESKDSHSTEARYQDTQFKFEGWTLVTASRQLFCPENIEVSLSSRSYDLLLVFLEHPQQVLSRDQLLTILSHRTAEPFDRSIDVQISRLRQKLGDDSKEPKMIKTIRNGGYLFAYAVVKTNGKVYT